LGRAQPAAELYVEEGALAGVKGDIAFAQSIIETGSFTEFHGFNFSGIGVCDSCTGGYLFGAARDGVRAQMQLLRSYADPTSRAAELPVSLSPVLYGSDPVMAARRFDTFFLKGAAPLWNEMGNGNWATDPYYAGKVLGVYARMLVFVGKSASESSPTS
jgi:Mannosyl-glycoprotein endo-beta-N-acetylglucosaminidase